MLLIVENDNNHRYALSELLKITGYKVVAISGGREAIELLRKQKFDLIISDIKMAGVTGIQVIQEAKRLYPETPFIFLSAFVTKDDKLLGYRLGCDRYITKPYTIKEILEAIKELLEKE